MNNYLRSTDHSALAQYNRLSLGYHCAYPSEIRSVMDLPYDLLSFILH